ncbi:MAG: SBBP repeat-containing protein [Spirochaetes bacterium]|nr:SBBP repeat-containing protein [Spirochaetota bacterium]
MMKYFYFLILFFQILFSVPLQGKWALVWTQSYNGVDSARGRDLTLDRSGNVYIVGDKNNSNPNFMTLKINPDSTIEHMEEYDSGDTDFCHGIVVDSHSNVYIAGFILNGILFNMRTIKYDPLWNIGWIRGYTAGNHDEAWDIAYHNSGYIYVTGYTRPAAVLNRHFCTLKYHTNGNTIWTQTFDQGISKDEESRAVAVDNSGNIYVTGIKDTGIHKDYFTIKYDPSGNTIWTQQYDSGGHDEAFDIGLDNSGYVYVTGYRYNGINKDWYTIKYSTNGNVIWSKDFDSGHDDEATYITLDNWNFLYVTGHTNGSRLTLKYDNQGNIIDYHRHDHYIFGTAVNDQGFVYVLGYKSLNFLTNYCFLEKYLQPPYPYPPTLLALTPLSGSVNLNWQDNTINEGGFKIFRSPDGINFYPLGTSASNVSSFHDKSIKENDLYWYKVIATNKAGTSLPSNVVYYPPWAFSSLKTGVYPNYIDLSKGDITRIFLAQSGLASINIYNLSGNLVKSFDKQYYVENTSQIWDGTVGDEGMKVGAGIYLVIIEGDSIKATFKLVVKK